MSYWDSDEKDGKKRKHVTTYSRIEEISEKYERAPTTNELRAIKELPLQLERHLFDTSPIGIRIFDLLKKSEDTRDVSLLEEAGRLLWSQTLQPLVLDQDGHVFRTDLVGGAYNRHHPTHTALVQHISSRGKYQDSRDLWSPQALPDPHKQFVAHSSGANQFHGPAPKDVLQQPVVSPLSGQQIVPGNRGGLLTTSNGHGFTPIVVYNPPLAMRHNSSDTSTPPAPNLSFASNTSSSQSDNERQGLPLRPSSATSQQQDVSFPQASIP